MGRLYSIVVKERSLQNTTEDILEIEAAAGKVYLLHEFGISQHSDDDVGDAEEELVDLYLNRHGSAATGGTGGMSITPTPLDPGDAACGATVTRNNSTQISGGSPVALPPIGFNVRAQYEKIWTPECRPIWRDGQFLVFTLGHALADTVAFNYYAIIEEIG